MDVCLQLGGRIIIWVYTFVWEVQLPSETRASLPPPEPARVEYPVAYSWVSWRPATTFSRKRAGKQLALRVSSHKQTVTVCTQGECYQPAIISRQEFVLPKDLPKHASIRSSNWFGFLSVSWEERVVKLRKCHSVYRQMFTCIFLSYKASQLSALVPQRCRWPVAHPVLRGSAVPVSSVGVWMCRLGRVHPWRVRGKIMLGFFKQHKYLSTLFSPPPLHSRFRILRLLKCLKMDSRTFICLIKMRAELIPGCPSRSDQLGVVWSILHSKVVLELYFKMKNSFHNTNDNTVDRRIRGLCVSVLRIKLKQSYKTALTWLNKTVLLDYMFTLINN